MSIEIMKPDASFGHPPKKIDKDTVSVYQMIGPSKNCFELMRFKASAGGITFFTPKLRNGTHISYHPTKIHLVRDGNYSDVNINSFYETHKRFTTIKSPCICIRLGRKIRREDLEKIIPILRKFLPRLRIKQSKLQRILLLKRFAVFRLLY